MTTFIIIAALMVAAALAWVLWPLLRPANRASVERRMVNLSVYKDQFADLDTDLARGSITQDNYNEAKAELERRMLEESRFVWTSPWRRARARSRPAATPCRWPSRPGGSCATCSTRRSPSSPPS